jgi:hypothetical protein
MEFASNHGQGGRRNIMSKQDNNSLLPKLALGMALFIALKFGTKVLAWWAKRNKKQGEIL